MPTGIGALNDRTTDLLEIAPLPPGAVSNAVTTVGTTNNAPAAERPEDPAQAQARRASVDRGMRFLVGNLPPAIVSTALNARAPSPPTTPIPVTVANLLEVSAKEKWNPQEFCTRAWDIVWAAPGMADLRKTQLAEQKVIPRFKPEDMLPGDVAILYENKVFSDHTHARTTVMQMGENHNGIADNQGRPNLAHATMWAAHSATVRTEQVPVEDEITPRNPEFRQMTHQLNEAKSALQPDQAKIQRLTNAIFKRENQQLARAADLKNAEKTYNEPQQVGARGSLGDRWIMGVTGQAMQPGFNYIYRCKDRNASELAAALLQCWDGSPYSTGILGDTMKSGDRFAKMTEQSYQDLFLTMLSASEARPHHTIPGKSPVPNPAREGKFVWGDSCSTSLFRAYQVAFLMIAVEKSGKLKPQRPSEEKINETVDKQFAIIKAMPEADRKILDFDTDSGLRARLRESASTPTEPDDARIKAVIAETMTSDLLPPAFRMNANGVSVRTLEHALRFREEGQPEMSAQEAAEKAEADLMFDLFDLVGIMDIEKSLYEEPRFAAPVALGVRGERIA